MAETLDLTTSITYPTPPPVTRYHVRRVLIEREPFARFAVLVVGDDNTQKQITYSDEDGGTTIATLLAALNTANLSTKSLQRRILERLVADGYLPAGTVTGTPD